MDLCPLYERSGGILVPGHLELDKGHKSARPNVKGAEGLEGEGVLFISRRSSL